MVRLAFYLLLFFILFILSIYLYLYATNRDLDALRVNFLFGRNDLYFYNVTQTYAGAEGVNDLASVFSVDK